MIKDNLPVLPLAELWRRSHARPPSALLCSLELAAVEDRPLPPPYRPPNHHSALVMKSRPHPRPCTSAHLHLLVTLLLLADLLLLLLLLLNPPPLAHQGGACLGCSQPCRRLLVVVPAAPAGGGPARVAGQSIRTQRVHATANNSCCRGGHAAAGGARPAIHRLHCAQRVQQRINRWKPRKALAQAHPPRPASMRCRCASCMSSAIPSSSRSSSSSR